MRKVWLALLLPAAAFVVAPVSRGASPVETVVANVEIPWALAFAPDGRLFFTERHGRLRVVNDGQLAPEPVARLSVWASGEAGLMGLALDPDFARNGHLYVCYTTSKGSGVVNRIARLGVRSDTADRSRGDGAAGRRR